MHHSKKIYCIFDETENLLIDSNAPKYNGKCAFNKVSKAKCFVKKFYDNHQFRYLLEYKLNEKAGKSIAIILMNPSFADNNYLDNTLYNVKTFIENIDKKQEFCKFIVLNIFPIRTPNHNNLYQIMKNNEQQQKINDDKIREVLGNINDVVIAWGKEYHKIAIQKDWFKELKNKSIKKYAYGINYERINKCGTPKHFSPYAYSYRNINSDRVLKNYQIEFNENNEIYFININN